MNFSTFLFLINKKIIFFCDISPSFFYTLIKKSLFIFSYPMLNLLFSFQYISHHHPFPYFNSQITISTSVSVWMALKVIHHIELKHRLVSICAIYNQPKLHKISKLKFFLTLNQPYPHFKCLMDLSREVFRFFRTQKDGSPVQTLQSQAWQCMCIQNSSLRHRGFRFFVASLSSVLNEKPGILCKIMSRKTSSCGIMQCSMLKVPEQ